jgi:hypothetical protein
MDFVKVLIGACFNFIALIRALLKANKVHIKSNKLGGIILKLILTDYFIKRLQTPEDME